MHPLRIATEPVSSKQPHRNSAFHFFLNAIELFPIDENVAHKFVCCCDVSASKIATLRKTEYFFLI